MNRPGLFAALALCLPIAAGAQTWPDKNRWTPRLVQTGFGPNGSALPFDGADYCGPTSVTMALGYLNRAGFTQLLGPSATRADFLNLLKVMTGLMGSSDSGGTASQYYLNKGLHHYFSAKGIGPADVTITRWDRGDHRTLAQIAASNVGQNILVATIGWYVQNSGVYDRIGGHFVVVTDQDPARSTLTVHNPYPFALLDQPNRPADVLQTLPMVDFAATRQNTRPSLGDATYLQFDTARVGPQLPVQGILEKVQAIHVDASRLPASGFVPQDWRLDKATTLNTGGGDLIVDARVTGTGAIRKIDAGDLVFRRRVTLTGDHRIQAGGITSEVTGGHAFGTGSIALAGTGQLKFPPDDTAPAPVALAVAARPPAASREGARIRFSGGNRIELRRGANPSLTVTAGGNTGNGLPNLVPNGWAATLVIDADDLGGTERLRIRGTDGNLPPVANGMVGGNIVGSRGPAQSGRFLTHEAAAHGGFRGAATVSGDIDAVTATTVYQATSSQSLTGPASVYALEVGDGLVIRGPGRTLGVGDGTSPAGIILNGGRLSIGTLAFGTAPAAIYTNTAGGRIDAALTGSGGLVKFGPGRLALNAPSPRLAGPVFVNGGTLALNAPAALGGRANHVTLRKGSVLEVAAGATVTGPVLARGYAVIDLDGGTLGTVHLLSGSGPAGPIQGATLRGHGTITGDLALDGYLAGSRAGAPGTLTIDGLVKADAGAAFIWSLRTLVDDLTGTPGTDWTTLVLTNPNATFGTRAQPVAVLFDFSPRSGPDGGNAFWQSDHKWTLFTFSGQTTIEEAAYLEFPSEAFPAGHFSYGHDGNVVSLHYKAGAAQQP